MVLNNSCLNLFLKKFNPKIVVGQTFFLLLIHNDLALRIGVSHLSTPRPYNLLTPNLLGSNVPVSNTFELIILTTYLAT